MPGYYYGDMMATPMWCLTLIACCYHIYVQLCEEKKPLSGLTNTLQHGLDLNCHTGVSILLVVLHMQIIPFIFQ